MLLAALPGRPVQLAHAILAAGFDLVIPVSWGEEVLAEHALRVLERATLRWPTNRDLLLALATMQRDAGKAAAARATVQRLAAAYPNDREVAALAQQLR